MFAVQDSLLRRRCCFFVAVAGWVKSVAPVPLTDLGDNRRNIQLSIADCETSCIRVRLWMDRQAQYRSFS